MRIKHAVRWDNGMVMVFDENDEQITELQGRFEDVRAKILAACDEDTEFEMGSWERRKVAKVSCLDWFTADDWSWFPP